VTLLQPFRLPLHQAGHPGRRWRSALGWSVSAFQAV